MLTTYPDMARKFIAFCTTHGLQAKYVIAPEIDDAIRYAKEHEPEVSAFLSRGTTAVRLREVVSVPVITIPITPYDVITAFLQLPEDAKDVAIISSYERIFNAQDVASMYQINLREYTTLTKKDIYLAVKDISENGLRYVIGGGVAREYCREFGLTCVEFSLSDYSANRAVQETLQILEEREKEKHNSAIITSAFSSITEGVIISAPDSTVISSNSAAEKILGCKVLIGDRMPKTLSDQTFDQVLKWKTPSGDYTIKVGDKHLSVSHRPVFSDGRFLGVVTTINNVTYIQRLENQIRRDLHTRGFQAKYGFDDILTASPNMKQIKEFASLVATTESTVLIEGESGTGKELLAQSIHNAGSRKGGPFVAINCAAIPENLMESEMFGYEGGSFTGAKKEGKPGFFELAHGGTLFLDEVGELSAPMQTRLLRVLQEKEILRVGGSKIIPVDVRIISATNRDLFGKVNSNQFRADLYYRLNVFNIHVPPLRDRKNDIPLIVGSILNSRNIQIEESVLGEYLKQFCAYDWPGNIRELQNATERMILVSSQFRDKALDSLLGLPLVIASNLLSRSDCAVPNEMTVHADFSSGLKDCIQKVEHQIISYLMEQTGGNQDLVSDLLKIGKTTLWRKNRDDPQE